MTDKQKNPHVAIKGKCMWAHVQEPQLTWSAKEEGLPDSDYCIMVDCDKALFAKLKKAGIHSSIDLKEYEGIDGQYLKLKKSGVKTTRKGDVIEFPPLQVIDKNQKPLKQKVGNGSLVNCIVELVKTKLCTTMRLKCVQVLDLVEYLEKDPDSDYLDLLEGEKEVSIVDQVGTGSEDAELDDIFM